jgi:hypothetical protein
LELPIVNIPNPTLNYPVIDVPTQEEFDAAVKAEQTKTTRRKEEKTRGLPDSKPILPQVQVPQESLQVIGKLIRDTNQQTNLGVPVIEVPIIGQVPVPPKEQVILAGTTATASVAAALVRKSLVEWMVGKMKPIVQQIFVRGKKLLVETLPLMRHRYYLPLRKQSLSRKSIKY